MKDSETIQRKVFLSSTFEDTFDGEKKYIPLRRRIIDVRDTLPVELLAYDSFWPEDSEPNDVDADTIVDRCFSGIRDCDLFVFVLSGRHGSGVDYVENGTLSSYLELELFAAAVLEKPVLLLHIKGHEPEEALKDSLILLKEKFSDSEYIIDNEKNLFTHFNRVCQLLATGIWHPSCNKSLSKLPDWLSIKRTKNSLDKDLVNPSLLFLNGKLFSKASNVDPDKAKLLLYQVASGVRLINDSQMPMPHGVALFRLWAAMRQLMDQSGKSISDPLIAPLWDKALGLWASNASWFGLHGHVWMGPLAAVNLQGNVRLNLGKEPEFFNNNDVREPLGARASAIYSIAQRMHTRERKIYHFRQTIKLAEKAIKRDTNAQQGALSIRGHASMKIGSLGYLSKFWEAEKDFRLSLTLREKSGSSPASIGEAMADLGLCMIFTGHPIKGLSCLQDGIELMRTSNTANGKAFLARGLRKLEHGARLTFRKKIANAAHVERIEVTKEIEAFDQRRD